MIAYPTRPCVGALLVVEEHRSSASSSTKSSDPRCSEENWLQEGLGRDGGSEEGCDATDEDGIGTYSSAVVGTSSFFASFVLALVDVVGKTFRSFQSALFPRCFVSLFVTIY